MIKRLILVPSPRLTRPAEHRTVLGPRDDLVVRIADAFHEGVIEGATHWGAAFPICPEHRSQPMDAEVVADVASRGSLSHRCRNIELTGR